MAETNLFTWTGRVMAMHSILKLQYSCQVTIDGVSLRFTWNGNTGRESRSYSEIEILGSDYLEDVVYLFVFTRSMAFKKYRFKSLVMDTDIQPNSVKGDLMRLHTAVRTMRRLTIEKSVASRDRLIFIVNPKSGKGQAVEIMHRISPIFHVFGVEPVVHFTERSGHANHFMSTLDVSMYKGAVCVGGDGTVNETITGLLRNPTYSQSEEMDFTVGVIPAGTDGAFAKFVTKADPEDAAAVILRSAAHLPRTIPILKQSA